MGNILKKFFILMVRGYQVGISPFLGSSCRFQPTCSGYAIEAFQKFPIPKALWYLFKRLIKCHPFHPGGHDPLP